MPSAALFRPFLSSYREPISKGQLLSRYILQGISSFAYRRLAGGGSYCIPGWEVMLSNTAVLPASASDPAFDLALDPAFDPAVDLPLTLLWILRLTLI
jgi:hypothetical protein